MPFISVTTANHLEASQKEKIKTSLGELITLIPNKTEKVLMIDIADDHTMYFNGKSMDNCAYLDIRLYGTAPFKCKEELTKALYQMLNDILGLTEDQIYISFGEYNTWGTMGQLK